MTSFVTSAAIFLLLANICSSVNVKVGGHSFTLDEVKELKNIPRISPRNYGIWCNGLPAKFKAACFAKPGEAYAVLTQVAGHPDKCDVCAFAACFGCWSTK
ncbi:guanylin-like [Lissotriton helveticus]